MRQRQQCGNVLSRKDKPRISAINLAEESRKFGAVT